MGDLNQPNTMNMIAEMPDLKWNLRHIIKAVTCLLHSIATRSH